MKFFFPDSQDQIDPSFNFLTEERSIYRIRQRDDYYAHEALRTPPFDGILVSKAIVDGLPGSSGRYSLAQRHRFYRVGVREFFRLDSGSAKRLETMGDCGAFTYVREPEPPYTIDEVIDFYEEGGFDLGISVDHVILGFDPQVDRDRLHPNRNEWRARQLLTLELAAKFRRRCAVRDVRFEPLGVAQGWSPRSYADAVRKLQKMGYRRIAVGGLVPLKTPDLLDCLSAINDVREKRRTRLHLLGVTRCENVSAFAARGVTSFDSTSPFRQSFKDDTDNYYALKRAYTALRVPQVDGNPKLKGRIRAGMVSQSAALRLENDCLTSLRRFDAGEIKAPRVLRSLRAYDELCGSEKDRSDEYNALLEAAPWRRCKCGICARVGIDVAIFRGAERNKRRGFHNLYVFNMRLQRRLQGAA
jgi:hypothetical protein